ncbi:ComF family protein [Allosphingosinicella deserti]|uniref:Amidophosphoribosyltransferase n=1 Tax=Allosphingosinicella deserti TaxID=2116704 RepID=A0A2P7QP45_9SPHN|nr:ComF family protein [Sphingomonas deserti]PSJ39742.1 hypothetical protein C7I55_14265 [Sphingomonas deserti]
MTLSRIVREGAGAAARGLLDFALPPRCPSCGIIVPDPHRFCLACWNGLHFLGAPCCVRCGLPFDFDAGIDSECAGCLADPPPFDRLRAAVAYGDIARKVALKLKYSGRPGVAETLAALMVRHLAAADDEALLVPVPLHRWRIWSRGYNQSALIADALSTRTGTACAKELLRRDRHTPPLRGLGRRERADAVRGVFALAQGAAETINGRRIVLVDDVFTTGATVGACARALKRGGAARVDILCWARVVKSEDG